MTPTLIGNATLYTFSAIRTPGPIKVVRITESKPSDWHEWPNHYSKRHPNIGELLEISAIELVDERTGDTESSYPSTSNRLAKIL